MDGQMKMERFDKAKKILDEIERLAADVKCLEQAKRGLDEIAAADGHLSEVDSRQIGLWVNVNVMGNKLRLTVKEAQFLVEHFLVPRKRELIAKRKDFDNS